MKRFFSTSFKPYNVFKVLFGLYLCAVVFGLLYLQGYVLIGLYYRLPLGY